VQPRAAQLAHALQSHWKNRHLVDTRHLVRHFGAATQKLKESDAARLVGKELELDDVLGDDEWLALAQQVAKRSNGMTFLTRGRRGLVLCHKREVHTIPGILIPGPTDAVGAGDTVTAALAACLASGIDCVQAACLANLAASITVRKINQTGAATERELIEAARRVTYLFHPGPADESKPALDAAKNDFQIVDAQPAERIRPRSYQRHGRRSRGPRSKSPRLRRPL
jgi:bifunctional ADP-heptose synthase (sugar kinase/adenylyltransferase)